MDTVILFESTKLHTHEGHASKHEENRQRTLVKTPSTLGVQF